MVEQGSQAWHYSRLGVFTASEVYRLMADAKRPMTDAELAQREKGSRATTIVDDTLLADGAQTYVIEVASERITGLPAKYELETIAMKWGKDNEPIARKLYSAVYDVEVEECGFIPYLTYGGASPDGLILLDTGMEVKCPISQAMHLQYRSVKTWEDLKENHKNHYWQTQKGMLATGRKLWKFVSYHPAFPVLKQLHVVDVPRNEADIALLKIKLEAANKAAVYLETV